MPNGVRATFRLLPARERPAGRLALPFLPLSPNVILATTAMLAQDALPLPVLVRHPSRSKFSPAVPSLDGNASAAGRRSR